MSSTLDASIFMVKGILRKVTGNNLTMETDVRHILQGDSRTIRLYVMVWLQLLGKILHGNNFWSVMKKSSVSRTRRFTYFSDSVLCLGRVNGEPTIKYCLGRQVDVVQEITTITEFWTQLLVNQWIFEWNIVPGFTTLQHCNKVQEFMSKNERSTRRI